MVIDPPYLVDYRGDNRPPTWGTAARPAIRRSSLGPIHQPQDRPGLLRGFPAGRPGVRPGRARARLPVLRRPAGAAALRRLGAGRAARPRGADLVQEPAPDRPLRLCVDLRADRLRLAQGVSSASLAATPGGQLGGLGDSLGNRGRCWRRASHDEAGRVLPQAAALSHTRR